MAQSVTWLDRLRIERVVWSLDQRLYDLPRKVRIARRREVRDNLLTAAADIGTGPALARLGDSRRLAEEYRSAEYGEEARPAWVAAAVFLLTGQLVLTEFLNEAAVSFGQGLTAADPHATGNFTWSGIDYLQSSVTYTYVDGQGTFVGGAWTPVAYALWIIATVLVGRLWRVPVLWRRRRQETAAA